MQIIYLPDCWTILLCFVLWPVLQFSAAYVCHYLPDRVYSQQSWIFRTYHFEKDGRLYDRLFRVNKWKRLLPDGSIAPKKRRFSKKHLKDFSEKNLAKFILESARAELTHWLAIPLFLVFGLIVPARILWYMLAYALLSNLPCIITQRYNRPRVQRLLNRIKSNTQKNGRETSDLSIDETEY